MVSGREALLWQKKASLSNSLAHFPTNGFDYTLQRPLLQGDNSGQYEPPVDLVPALLAAGWPQLWLSTDQAG